MVRHATREGTARYQARFVDELAADHFRLSNDLWFSSIGMGIHVSEVDSKQSARYREAVALALASGCNHIDAAITHQSQRGEQIVGQALAGAFAKGDVGRQEVIVSAHGGAIHFAGAYPTDAAVYVRERLIDAGIAAADEFAQDWHHCMSPKFLRMQFRQCLTNLGLGTVDIFYLHNPEVQRVERGPNVFDNRLLAAFAELESQVRAERLAYYGIASLDGFRVPPGDPAFLSLARVVELARDAGGDAHRFRYVQVPSNLAMREVIEFKNQIVNGREMTLIEAAKELEVVVIGASSLCSGQLAMHLPVDVQARFPEAQTSAQAAIQFARSVPGVATAVVGMWDALHVQENMQVARVSPAGKATLQAVLDTVRN